MGRTKTKLRYILNDTDRRTSLKKRRNGVMKKVREISILCGVPACAIIYEPESPEPMVWPNAQQVIRVLDDFRSLPEMAQRRKMLTQEEFIFKRKEKLEEQLRRQRRESNELELNIRVNRVLAGMSLNNLRIEESRGIDRIINMRQRALKDQMKKLMETEMPISTERAKEMGKGKAPMYADVSEKEQQIAPRNYWFTDTFVREWLENDMAKKAVTFPLQNYSLLDDAEKEWLENENQQTAMYQATMLTQQTYSFANALAEQERLEKERQQMAPMYQTAVLPQQTYLLIDTAEQERLEMEKEQQKSITWSYDMPALNEQMSFQNSMEWLEMEKAQQKSITWSYDMPALDEHMSFQNSMGTVGIGGLEEAMQPYLDAGTTWPDSDSFPF